MTALCTPSRAGSQLTPAEHLATLMKDFPGIFERMDIAEDEVTAAQLRHPTVSNRLWHAFKLLTPTHERMDYEPIYRSHCREILDRVAAGGDTRLGTAAEVCCLLSDISKVTPMRSAPTGLYFRAWRHAGLPTFPELVTSSEHHEGLEGSRIDDHESEMRRKLAVAARHLDRLECRGLHHGERVNCAYGSEAALAAAAGKVAAS